MSLISQQLPTRPRTHRISSAVALHYTTPHVARTLRRLRLPLGLEVVVYLEVGVGVCTRRLMRRKQSESGRRRGS